jgi:hypothetical protein
MADGFIFFVEEPRITVVVEEEETDNKDNNKNNKDKDNKNNNKNQVQEPAYDIVMVEKAAVIGGFGGGFAVSDSGGKGDINGGDQGMAAAYGQGVSSGGVRVLNFNGT